MVCYCSPRLLCLLVSYLPIDDDVEHYFSVNIDNHEAIDRVRAVVGRRVNQEVTVVENQVARVQRQRYKAVMVKVYLLNIDILSTTI